MFENQSLLICLHNGHVGTYDEVYEVSLFFYFFFSFLAWLMRWTLVCSCIYVRVSYLCSYVRLAYGQGIKYSVAKPIFYVSVGNKHI